MTTATAARRFPILFTGLNRGMKLLGIVPSASYVDVFPTEVHVRMAWGFSLRADRATVRSAAPDQDPVWGWGAHGWRGRWLVNGSSQNLVRITFDPPAPGRCLVFPLRVHTLRVSVTDPDGLVAEVTSRP
jgi:hypothetical protein